MITKRKFGKLGIGILAFLTSSTLSSALVFASPISSNTPTPLSTPYGVMTGKVSADINNVWWGAATYITGSAPVIYVSGQCQQRSTGISISSNSNTSYNTTQANTDGSTYQSTSVTVFSTHEVRGTSSYVRYCSVSQAY